MFYVPATKLASDNKISKLANMIIMGKVLKETNGFSNEEGVLNALKQVISSKHADMLEVNLNAMRLGRDF